MPEGQWYDPDTIREVWDDAPLDAELCELVVNAALEEVLFYLVQNNLWEEGRPILARHRLGQLLHTKNTWNAQAVGPGGGTGEGEFVIRPIPLDWAVKQRLNPKSNVPVIG
jgi:hypothetical protein